MLEFATTIDGDRVSVSLPDPSAITVPAVAKAAIEVREVLGDLHAARRTLSAAYGDVEAAKEAVKRKAAELAISKKELPKDIRKAIKHAEEALADAKVEHEAREAAFQHAYRGLVAEVNANRKALEADALKGAEVALERMALARKAFENAAADAHATFGLLGMFRANDEQGRMLLKFRDPKGSSRSLLASIALEHLGPAVGRAALELEAFKAGTPIKRATDE